VFFVSTLLFLIRGSSLGVIYVHKGMGKANFGPIDGAIASCFDEGQVLRILRVHDDAIHGLLPQVRTRNVQWSGERSGIP